MADSAHLDLLGRGVDEWNRDRPSRVDLRGAQLLGAQLQGVDLRRADLRQAVLDSADLTGANLGGAVVRLRLEEGSYLTDANLTNAGRETMALLDIVSSLRCPLHQAFPADDGIADLLT